MERTPTFLAAIASAGVPGLDPVSVEALPSVPEQDYDIAFVQDTEHRRWVVRAPRSELAAARQDLTVTLLQLLARRLPFTVPSPRGFVELRDGSRAMVYPYLPGHNLAFDTLPAGAGPAAELGRALAALHNTDPRLFDEAGMPSYDPDAYRTRRLAELDRAAESGRVPTALLARWERALEDVALWRFAPTPIHGDLTGDQVLAVFEDDADASTGRIRGITGWEDAKVADPADDFATLVDEAPAATVETVLEAYAHARVERPDANLLVRARLAAELSVLAELMRADSRGDDAAVEGLSSRLRRLDEDVHAENPADDYHRTSLTPVALRGRATPPPAVAEDDEEDEDVEFEPASAAVDQVVDAEAAKADESVEVADPDEFEVADPDEFEVDEPDEFEVDEPGEVHAESVDGDEESTLAEVSDGPVPAEQTQPVPISALGLDLDFDEDEDEDLTITRPIPRLARPRLAESEDVEESEDPESENMDAPADVKVPDDEDLADEPKLTPEELPREGR